MCGLNLGKFMKARIIDAHVHFENILLIRETFDFFHTLGVEKLGILSLPRPPRLKYEAGGGSESFTTRLLRGVNGNPQAICFKAMHPTDTYIMGGLDYTGVDKHSWKRVEKVLAEQALRMMKIGFDGVKLIETKPIFPRNMPFNIDDPVYNSFFALLEEKQFPILWHVADPDEFWDKRRVPSWAKIAGWDYSSGTYPPKEDFYQRVHRVLSRFPTLKVIFAHFYFLSADLERASDVMDTWPNVNFDLTPNLGMYYNFSRNVEETRRFFLKYQDRIVFGTDAAIVGENIGREVFPKEWIAKLYFLMRNFLETDESFEMIQGFQVKGKGEIRGIKLPVPALSKIYRDNFLRIAGAKPQPLNTSAAKKECHRIGAEVRKKLGLPDDFNFAYQSENFLSSKVG